MCNAHPDKRVTIEFMKLDLSSFRSTKDFTVAFKERNLPLHILINNAGIFHVPFSQYANFPNVHIYNNQRFKFYFIALTEDGNELHFQVNYLSHFLLTLELLPIILDAAANTGDCRIVILASSGHYSGHFDPNNMNGEVSYSRVGFYQHSKLYTVSYLLSIIIQRL